MDASDVVAVFPLFAYAGLWALATWKLMPIVRLMVGALSYPIGAFYALPVWFKTFMFVAGLYHVVFSVVELAQWWKRLVDAREAAAAAEGVAL